ncbi:MAG: hypothetical protein M1819_000037 [Sarea resinae]|nr:MAG: hypothetical protein M1819_000037 [Sarea resinae]
MSGFPSLQPAFTALVEIDAPLGVGSLSKGAPLTVVPMTGGTLKAEPGFTSPALDAKFIGTGYDYIRHDPSGEHMRLDVRSQLKNKDGALFSLYYTGVIAKDPALLKVLEGSPDAQTTEFGNAFTHFTFETGSPALKELETSVFVGSGRFRIEKGKPTVVEYKISKVVYRP